MKKDFEAIIGQIKSMYSGQDMVPLHAPRFFGNEKRYLEECIDTTYVSYVGRFVTAFEDQVKKLLGLRNAVAIVNGTAALHMTLLSSGIGQGDEVITQALSFAATAAGIRHSGADPAFVDVDRDSLGMSPSSLDDFLTAKGERKANGLYDRENGKRIAAVIPMHTFGHPARIAEIRQVCDDHDVPLIEDAAESIGSRIGERHMGTYGKAAILSFNGNKTVTAGGGGMIVTNDDVLAERVRHISTTAKIKHRWEYFHDEVGYNLRLTNLNAAVACAQMEYLDEILKSKRLVTEEYIRFFDEKGIAFVKERPGCHSNYWLNAIIMDNREERDAFLAYSNDNGVQTRPAWTLLNKLPPYSMSTRTDLVNAEWLEDRIVNIPSGVRPWD